ncbi:hypothetical protein UCMB321_1102 [Pseudomonas batumici]|uniref:Uncharacterized protein n=1 Tax=Pseudomonas batumici TaxID=226910 RepID=A0A0C2EGF6_9PSED|nr:hypothetical protein UCMB321_1102 [Pseudomonas batumici]
MTLPGGVLARCRFADTPLPDPIGIWRKTPEGSQFMRLSDL